MTAGNSSLYRLGVGSSSPLVAGIDMAAKRPPSVCVLRGRVIEFVDFIEVELVAPFLSSLGVKLVGLDSPLSAPQDAWREVDLVGKRIGLKLLPPGWRAMRRLILRTLELLPYLRKYGIEFIETFPGAIDLECTFHYVDHRDYETKDHRDACLAAVSALTYLLGETMIIDASDGQIILPARCVRLPKTPRFGPSSSLRVCARLVSKNSQAAP